MINQYAIPPDQAGGTRHYDFAKVLIQAGWDVKIFASNIHLGSRKPLRDLENDLWKEETCFGVPFVWIKTRSYSGNNLNRVINMLVFCKNLIKAGKAQKKKPDVILGSSPNLFAASAALKLAKKKSARFLLEVRDLWPQSMIDLGFSRFHPMVILFSLIEKTLYLESERIIVLAEGSIEYLRKKKNVDVSKILYIPNGVDIDSFKPAMQRGEKQEELGLTKFTCAYIGAHGTANSLETVLEAANATKNKKIEWLLVGDGPEKPKLEKMAISMGLKNLRFLDSIPKKEVPDLLNAIDAAVISLKNADAFKYAISPNKLFDYMAGSCPILCAVPGQMAELVEKTGCGFSVQPENGSDLAKKALGLSLLPIEKRKEMGKKGRILIEQEYNREKLTKRLLETLSKDGVAQ